MAAVLTDPLLVAGFGHNHRHGGVVLGVAAAMAAGSSHSLLHGAEAMAEAMAAAMAAGFGHNHRHGAEAMAEDGGSHSLLHGAEAMAEDRAKDGLNHLDFRVYRAIPATGDGRQDECRDRHIPSRQCLGITDKRIIRRIVLAMGFLRG